MAGERAISFWLARARAHAAARLPDRSAKWRCFNDALTPPARESFARYRGLAMERCAPLGLEGMQIHGMISRNDRRTNAAIYNTPENAISHMMTMALPGAARAAAPLLFRQKSRGQIRYRRSPAR